MYDFQAIQEAIVKYRLLEIEFNQGQASYQELSNAARDVANLYYRQCLGNPYRLASRRAGDEWYSKARYYGTKAGVDIPDKALIVGFLEIEENSRHARFAIKAVALASVVLLAAVLYL